jgi:hypothetical protein
MPFRLFVLSAPAGARATAARTGSGRDAGRLGHRLQEAVILYTGQYAYRYEDWAWVLPLSQLWT